MIVKLIEVQFLFQYKYVIENNFLKFQFRSNFALNVHSCLLKMLYSILFHLRENVNYTYIYIYIYIKVLVHLEKRSIMLGLSFFQLMG